MEYQEMESLCNMGGRLEEGRIGSNKLFEEVMSKSMNQPGELEQTNSLLCIN